MRRQAMLLNTLLLVFLLGFPSPTHAKPSAEKPPNILLLVSDDQGYRDLGCFGSEEVKTPHLDQLASGGVRLTNFYVSWPACTPSRGSLLTGRYPQRHGVFDMIRNEAPDYGKQYTPAEYEATFERIGGMASRRRLLANQSKRLMRDMPTDPLTTLLISFQSARQSNFRSAGQ